MPECQVAVTEVCGAWIEVSAFFCWSFGSPALCEQRSSSSRSLRDLGLQVENGSNAIRSLRRVMPFYKLGFLHWAVPMFGVSQLLTFVDLRFCEIDTTGVRSDEEMVNLMKVSVSTGGPHAVLATRAGKIICR